DHGPTARAAGMAQEGQTYESLRWRFQAKKARANWRGVLGFVSPPPCQPLALAVVHGDYGALGIFNPELAAIVPAERKFVQITLKVLFAAVLIDTYHAALEHAEHAFNRVRGNQIGALTARVFLGRVIDGLVIRELLAQRFIERAFVS